jgi:predicted DNA-binding protein with PD1-like motif
MKIHALRLKPDQDLRLELKKFAIAHHIQAGYILSAIGSFKQVALRFADQPSSTVWKGRYELLSLAGTLSVHGMHLHMAIADNQGRAFGGHLTVGCILYTTAEIIIGESEDLTFLRTLDPQTGFLELEILETSEVLKTSEV